MRWPPPRPIRCNRYGKIGRLRGLVGDLDHKLGGYSRQFWGPPEQRPGPASARNRAWKVTGVTTGTSMSGSGSSSASGTQSVSTQAQPVSILRRAPASKLHAPCEVESELRSSLSTSQGACSFEAGARRSIETGCACVDTDWVPEALELPLPDIEVPVVTPVTFQARLRADAGPGRCSGGPQNCREYPPSL